MSVTKPVFRRLLAMARRCAQAAPTSTPSSAPSPALRVLKRMRAAATQQREGADA